MHHPLRSLRESSWNKTIEAVKAAYPYIRKKFGAYPYRQFSIIQGGDGPMEYAMATLVTDGGLEFIFHEFMHSWFQGVLGTNEQRHAWMDEGFAQWAGEEVYYHYIKQIANQKIPENSQLLGSVKDNFDLKRYPWQNIHQSRYRGYYEQLKHASPAEAMSVWADHYEGSLYSTNAYSKGLIFLEQLKYIVGIEKFDNILLAYYQQWKFKHPGPTDFIRVAEKLSGMQLGWYEMYWVNTTKTIDYGIDSAKRNSKKKYSFFG